MVAAHGAVRPRLRITTGLLGFSCVLAAVVWVRSFAAVSLARACALPALALVGQPPSAAVSDPPLAPNHTAQMDAMPPSGRALAALLALVGACGVFDGLTAGALYGEAGVLAPRYTQALATGNSAAGGQACCRWVLPHVPAGRRPAGCALRCCGAGC